MTWLRGTNGSGKTSLMRILAGLSQPAAGRVSWTAQPGPPVLPGDDRQQLVYIGHANALKDDLSLIEAVAFLAALAGMDRALHRAGTALERMGLGSRLDAPVRTLSQGQRRRAALARLLLDDAPRTWLLDEPFDALDAANVATLVRLIENHAARQGLVLFTSHQQVVIANSLEFDLEPWRVAS